MTAHTRPASDAPRGLGVTPLARAADVPAVSPRMTAVFGGLFGMAVMASIVALLIQVFPVENQRDLAEQSDDGTVASATAQDIDKPKTKRRVRKLLPEPWRVSKLKDSHLIATGTMQRRSFISALDEAHVPKKQIYRILKAMEGVHKFDHTGKNDKFSVAMKRGTKEVVAFDYEVDGTEIYQARTGDDGLLKGARLDMVVRQEDYATSFYVGKDLVKSYKAAGLEDGLLSVIDDAFNGRTSHEAFEEGGVVKLIVVETTALGRFVRYERIKALEYRPPDPSQAPLRAYWFQGSNVKGYVDERGRRPSNRGWRTPVPGAPITSNFNPTRMHPVLKRVMPHNGTDYGAPSGTPVFAAYRGTVALVGMHGASGNLVLVDHPGGVQTGYAHLSRFAPGIKKGDKVGTRQLVGYVGSTGRSTGPHLHFSAKRDGKFFDSRELKLDALHLLPVTEREVFLQQKSVLDAALETLPLPDPPPEEPAEPVSEAGDETSGDEGAGEETSEGDDKGDEGDDEGDEAEPNEQSDHAADKPAGKSEPAGKHDSLLGEDLSGDIE